MSLSIMKMLDKILHCEYSCEKIFLSLNDKYNYVVNISDSSIHNFLRY